MINMYVLVSFILYLLVMIGIGVFFSRKADSLDAYYLGGRSMNKWVVALSAQASDMSGWLLMGLPGAIYLAGLSEMWIGVGLAVGTYFNWRIVARRLRTYSHACGDSITIPDFFSNRFRDESGMLRMVSALIILCFFLFYTASGFLSCAKLFATTFGLDYHIALLVGAVIVISYTLSGGFFAVCWTDVIQGSIMVFALVAVPVAAVFHCGGYQATVDTINSINASILNPLTSAATGKAVAFVAILSSLAWGLGYFGMPHILVRFMSIKDPKEITTSRHIAVSWVIIALAASVSIGVLGLFWAKSAGVEVADSERIFMMMAEYYLPPVLFGFAMAAILAAIMSTADSQLLVSASAFTNDLFRRIGKGRIRYTDNTLMRISRFAVAAIALIAIAIVWNPEGSIVSSVMKLVSFAWGGFGAAFGPVMLLALFWRRTNKWGAMAGLVTGTLTCFLWKYALPLCGGFGAELAKVYELLPGFILAFAAIVAVSLLTPPPEKEVADEFDSVRKSDNEVI